MSTSPVGPLNVKFDVKGTLQFSFGKPQASGGGGIFQAYGGSINDPVSLWEITGSGDSDIRAVFGRLYSENASIDDQNPWEDGEPLRGVVVGGTGWRFTLSSAMTPGVRYKFAVWMWYVNQANYDPCVKTFTAPGGSSSSSGSSSMSSSSMSSTSSGSSS